MPTELRCRAPGFGQQVTLAFTATLIVMHYEETWEGVLLLRLLS